MKTLEEHSKYAVVISVVILCLISFAQVKLFPSWFYRIMDVTSYLVFHNIAELFSVIVSFSIFGIGWFSYEKSRDSHSLFLSCAFLAIGLMDLMHTLSYPGMPDFITVNVTNKSSQFWISVRMYSALTFLVSGYVRSGSSFSLISKYVLLASAIAVSSVVFTGIIFFSSSLPLTFIEGKGLTPLKTYSEYLIMLLLALSIPSYWRWYSEVAKTEILNRKKFLYFMAAIVICIFSEFAFTGYKSAFDTYNLLGHIYKIIAFFLIYKGVFIASVEHPYQELALKAEEVKIECQSRKKAEESLKESHVKLQQKNDELNAFFNVALDLLCIADTDGNFQLLNVAWERTLGYTKEELMARKFLDFIHPDDLAKTMEAVSRLTSQQDVSNLVNRYCCKDGSYRWIEWRSAPAGKLIYAAARDITEHKLTELVLKESEQRISEALDFNKSILSTSSIGILTYNPNGQCTFANESAAKITGTDTAQLLSQNFHEIESWKKSGLYVAASNALATDREAEIETFVISTFGKDVWLNVRLSTFQSKGERCLLVFIQDISDHRKLEEQLRQSQKMEALGQLAGGVAHDFNNALQVIMGYAVMLNDDAPPEQKEQLHEIIAASERAAELTRGLLSYSRKQLFKLEPVDMNDLVANVEKFLRRILGEDINFTLELASLPLVVTVDKSHMQQVFVNLATNSRDAISSGGRLSVHLGRMDMDDEFVRAHGFGKQGSYALISISDTGMGIPQEHIHKIFEPFFTTKGDGKGTGLGLSIVYGIITQHGGFITCYSEVGIGTTFCIYLPLASNEARLLESDSEDQISDFGKLTILLVEDDPSVLKVTKNILQAHGHIVLEAKNGIEALEIFRQKHSDVHLVILDVLMPEMNGSQTLNALREIVPNLKALFMSGYAREIISGKIAIPENVEFINKPVIPARLIERIRKIV